MPSVKATQYALRSRLGKVMALKRRRMKALARGEACEDRFG